MDIAIVLFDASNTKLIFKWIRENDSLGVKESLELARSGKINFYGNETKAQEFFEFLKFENITCNLQLDIKYTSEHMFPPYSPGIAWG